MSGMVFDGGSVGFDTYAFQGDQAVTRLVGENISLLRGADVLLASSTVGYVGVSTATGGARVNWT
jgi:hypothetical protein